MSSEVGVLDTSILIIGDGGTEKTRFTASCPGIEIQDFDKGMDSTTDILPVSGASYRTFKDAPFGSKAVNESKGIYPWGTAWPAFVKHMDNNLWPRIEAGETVPVAFDSLTTLANICMNFVLKSAGKTGRDTPEVQHWGYQLRLLETLMDQVTAWPTTLIVTAHIKRDDNLVQGTTEYLPMVAGQFSGRIGIYFNEVYYTKVVGTGKDRRVTLQTQSEGLYKQAKSRRNVPTGTLAKWAEVEKFLTGRAA